MTKLLNESLEMADAFLARRILLRLINEGVSVQSFRERLRTILKTISESVNISEGFIKRWVKYVSETVEISSLTVPVLGRVKIIATVISIGEVKLAVRALTRMIDNTVNIAEGLAEVLQEGLVKTSRAMGTFARGRTVKVSDRTKDVKLHDKSKIGRLADRVRNIKLFKRGRGVRGV
jgi:hypothetical protein